MIRYCIFESLPDKFSGAFCFGGNKSLIPMKLTGGRGANNSPIISESGLKTLSGNMDATGLSDGIRLNSFLGLLGLDWVGRSTVSNDRSATCFKRGAQLR